MKLSSSGLDLLIDCHCRLLRTTRSRLPYGTTLYVALRHLETVSTAEILDDLMDLPGLGLSGSSLHFPGAPNRLADVACGIALRLACAAADDAEPELGHIYLLALRRLVMASSEDILSAWKSLPSATGIEHGSPSNMGYSDL